MDNFAHSHFTDARGSTFSRVDGNQVNHIYHGPVTIYSTSTSTFSHLPVDNRSQLLADSETPLQRNLQLAHQAVNPLPIIEAAVILIDYLSTSLNDTADSSNTQNDLQSVLVTLRQILCVVHCAIKAYSGKPLGQSLTNAIAPEVAQCRVLLWELRDKIHGTWVGFMCTRISSLWRQAFRIQRDGDELASLKKRLNHSRNLLGMYAMALNSYVSFTFHPSQPAERPNASPKLKKCCMHRA